MIHLLIKILQKKPASHPKIGFSKIKFIVLEYRSILVNADISLKFKFIILKNKLLSKRFSVNAKFPLEGMILVKNKL